jgi:general stress protein 26
VRGELVKPVARLKIGRFAGMALIVLTTVCNKQANRKKGEISMSKQNTRAEDIKTLGEKIKDVRFAMITTVEPDGSLKSRPMTTQQTEFDGDLWFFASSKSDIVRAVQARSEVNVAYAKPDSSLYISVSGKAEVVRDKAKAKELWNPLDKAWFPDGVNDPDLVLLRIGVDMAEYWDAPAGKVVQLLGLAKSLLTGEEYDGTGSENREINL